MKANGKADLYFHAYFWEKYLLTLMEQSPLASLKTPLSSAKKADDSASDIGAAKLSPRKGTIGALDIFSEDYPFMKRVVGLSATLSKVIINIKKFPFHEKMYQKYSLEFG